ncbi:hypothetical protein RI367_002037 [Sorochytrium milnesiophthora]
MLVPPLLVVLFAVAANVQPLPTPAPPPPMHMSWRRDRRADLERVELFSAPKFDGKKLVVPTANAQLNPERCYNIVSGEGDEPMQVRSARTAKVRVRLFALLDCKELETGGDAAATAAAGGATSTLLQEPGDYLRFVQDSHNVASIRVCRVESGASDTCG